VLGEIALTGRDHVRIHTYTAPEEGWRVNSHIIETATQLFVVDAQYMLPYAGEVVAHAAALGKPITRLYLTHFHPDHVLGAPAFSCPIYALGAVAAKIGAVGDRIAAEEREKHGDAIPARAKRPDHIVTPGSEVVDGVRFDFVHLQHAETEHALMVGLSDHGVLITQDLVYDRVHAFVGERAFDSWTAAHAA
jgi:glyoxylase-like metal-dependent hydrolase (beta-lactamase superfamily II)